MFSVDSNNWWEMGNRKSVTKYRGGTIAVGVSADKTSQHALKWAIDYLVTPSSKNDFSLKLLHVAPKSPSPGIFPGNDGQAYDPIEGMLLPFRCYCTRKRVPFEIVIVKHDNVAEAMVDYISHHGIENIVLGTSRNGLSKRIFKTPDVPSSVQKLAADFCNVFTIREGKISAARAARCRLPTLPPLPEEFSYISRSQAASRKSYDEVSFRQPDIDTRPSFVGSERSTDSMFYSFYDNFEGAEFSQISTMSSNVDISVSASEIDFEGFDCSNGLHEMGSTVQYSNSGNPFLSQNVLEEMEEEMKGLRMELRKTREMYHAAQNEALRANQKAAELQEGKMEGEQRLTEALLTLEAAAAALKNRHEKSSSAEASQTLYAKEVQNRVNAKKLKESKVVDAFEQSSVDFKYQSLFHILFALLLFYMYSIF